MASRLRNKSSVLFPATDLRYQYVETAHFRQPVDALLASHSQLAIVVIYKQLLRIFVITAPHVYLRELIILLVIFQTILL
jgi:hypothetical protein